MGPPAAWKDEYTLLCERCGYVIEGLPRAGDCPECGKPIEESLPGRRTGTAWQQRPRIARLPATWWRSIRHPYRTLDTMRPQEKPDARLGVYSMFAGGLLMGWSWWKLFEWIYIRPMSGEPLVWAQRIAFVALSIGFGVLTAIVLTGLMWTLTRIETKGLGVIAKTRGFRLSVGYRRAITAHGCAGWVLAGVLFLCTNTLSNFALELSRGPDIVFETSTSGAIELPGSSVLPWWAYKIVWHLRWVGLLIGFLWFETFAYLGLRRLKFANSQPARSMEDAGS